MNTLRPDERASQAQIEREHGFNKAIKRTGQTALSLAAGVTGAGLASKLLPFLGGVIPIDLAIKGISKISPKLGDFLNQGMKQGLDVKEGLQFIKNKILPEDEKQSSGPLDVDQILNQAEAKGLQMGQQQSQAPQQGGGIDPQLMQIMQQLQNSMKKLGA